MSAPTKLAGRTVTISGAGSGIGRSLAMRLSRHGCPLALTDWNREGLETTLAQLSTPHISRILDVRDREAQLSWASEVIDWAPTEVGAVINNAGVVSSQMAVEAVHHDDTWLIDINFWGVVHGTQAFLPHLLHQRAGTVCNMSSLLGLLAFPTQTAYCASKFAVRGYTEALRLELRGTGVRALAIHPGGVNTPITRSGRVRVDTSGNPDPESFHQTFTALARTSPEKAAQLIHRGIDRGRARILVGPDAHLLNAMATVLPTRYYDIVGPLMPLGRRVMNAIAGP